MTPGNIVNTELLEEVIEFADLWLAKNKGEVGSRKKAKVIAIAYEVCCVDNISPQEAFKNADVAEVTRDFHIVR